ncbi:sulfite exporter TauE/SafE family protein [Hyphococcus sp.]|uniref:sulfite exporter TauE/SafE family protein n=1 Tax=Hyphococcus sp. TaxID=2038636 RepID=UPI0035C701DA
MPLYLIFLFFFTAALYASVGFGGGSTYNALLVLAGVDYRILPTIALACNIIVVAGGSYAFARSGHLRLKRIAPFLITSVPAAWAGGRIPVSETIFIGVLGFSLLVAGLHLAFDRNRDLDGDMKSAAPWLAWAAGGLIGFISGLVGIGGGIFLAPVLYFIRWGKPKEIAGACSLFILANSLSGLTGQLMKLGDIEALSMLGAYWMLFPAVLIGGQIGSRLANAGLSSFAIKRLTAVLILYVSVRLLLRWQGLIF